jgi:hypothetical protein
MRKIVLLALLSVLGSGLFAANYANQSNATVWAVGVLPSGNFYFFISGSGTTYYFSPSGDMGKAMVSIVMTAYTLGHLLDVTESNGLVTTVVAHR